MMYMPSIFGENLFDDFFNDFDRSLRADKVFGKSAKHLMKTDIREKEDGYELMVDLPGYHKEDLKLSLDRGYLTISGEKNHAEEEKDKEGRLIRQERYSGAIQRSFFVGDRVTEEDIKAEFQDGVLKLFVPKEEKIAVPEKKMIEIQ